MVIVILILVMGLYIVTVLALKTWRQKNRDVLCYCYLLDKDV